MYCIQLTPSDNRNKQKESVCRHHLILIFLKILPYRKYPEISCVEEREKYRAVFNDQYQEYKDLHRDISLTLSKFRELDATMARLLRDGKSQEVRWMYCNLYSTLSISHPKHSCDRLLVFNLR